MWDLFQSVIGWDGFTPQAVRFGMATFLALLALAPGRSSGFEIFAGLLFSIGAGIMVAQAVSLAPH
jgi:hypothetical protein